MRAIIFTIVAINLSCILGLPQAKEFPLKLQPELDVLDVETYLNNPRLLNLQIKCILYDGPCDVVGRWAKPRVKAGLLGECLLCTEKQKGWLDTWLDRLIKNFPDLYRAGIAKFISNSGVEVPKEEVEKLKSTLAKLDAGSLPCDDCNSTESTRQNYTTVAAAEELILLSSSNSTTS